MKIVVAMVTEMVKMLHRYSTSVLWATPVLVLLWNKYLYFISVLIARLNLGCRNKEFKVKMFRVGLKMWSIWYSLM